LKRLPPAYSSKRLVIKIPDGVEQVEGEVLVKPTNFMEMGRMILVKKTVNSPDTSTSSLLSLLSPLSY